MRIITTRGKEETITIVDKGGAARVQRRFAPLGEVEQMWSRLLAGQEAKYIREHEEEAAIEAEDFWGQAEEAGLQRGSYRLMGEEQQSRRYRWEDQAGKEVAMSTTSEEIRIGQMAVRFLLEGEQSGGSVAVFEFDVPAAGRVPAAHSHDAFDETIYGLDGVLSWTIDGAKTDVGPGDVLFIPRGVVHRFDNDHGVDAKMLAIVSPGILGPGYFRDMASVLVAAKGGPPDFAAFGEVMQHHGLTPAP